MIDEGKKSLSGKMDAFEVDWTLRNLFTILMSSPFLPKTPFLCWKAAHTFPQEMAC